MKRQVQSYSVSPLNVLMLFLLLVMFAVEVRTVLDVLFSVPLFVFLFTAVGLGAPRYRLSLLRKEPGVSIDLRNRFADGFFEPIDARVHADLGTIFFAEAHDLSRNREVLRVFYLAIENQPRDLEANAYLESLIERFVERLSQVFMPRVFHVRTSC
jgi:hypothetical protein